MKRILFFMVFAPLINVPIMKGMEADSRTTLQEHNKSSSQTSTSSQLSMWARALNITTETLSTLFVEVLTFDPKQRHEKIHCISENLTIVAPPDIEVIKTKYRLMVGGDYYDSTLKGKFFWKNGGLENKKGIPIAPLV